MQSPRKIVKYESGPRDGTRPREMNARKRRKKVAVWGDVHTFTGVREMIKPRAT